MSVFDMQAKEKGSGQFEPCPAGTHGARLVAVVDLGTHPYTYEGEEYRPRKVLLAWELVSCPDKAAGRNHVLGKEYNCTLGTGSHLRQMIEAALNRKLGVNESFNPTTLIGEPFLLTVVHGESAKGNTFASINSVGQPPTGFAVPPHTLVPYTWEFDSGEQFNDPGWLPFLYGKAPYTKILEAEESKQQAARHLAKQRQQTTAPAMTQSEADRALANEDSIPF